MGLITLASKERTDRGHQPRPPIAWAATVSPPLQPGPISPNPLRNVIMPPAFPLLSEFKLRTASLALSAVVLTGCMSLAPAPDTPPLPVPEVWPGHLESSTEGAHAGELAWQAYFTDPLLQRLIETALENNRDLRLAALRVEEASAAFSARIDFLPWAWVPRVDAPASLAI